MRRGAVPARARDLAAKAKRLGGSEHYVAISAKDARELGLPLQPPLPGGPSLRPDVLRWRANDQRVHWHQDGDGRMRTDGFLALWYLDGHSRLSLRFVSNPQNQIDVECEAGTTIVFDNTILEHCVPTDGYRAFFGPFLVRLSGRSAPPAGVPRGGEKCCTRGVETCCGNMCSRCRARFQHARDRLPRHVTTRLRHEFAYRRTHAPEARIALVEQNGERRVVYNGGEAHGSWHWLVTDILEINFNARPWKNPRKKTFIWSAPCWRSVEGPKDLIWQVRLHPFEVARDTPADDTGDTRGGLGGPTLGDTSDPTTRTGSC